MYESEHVFDIICSSFVHLISSYCITFVQPQNSLVNHLFPLAMGICRGHHAGESKHADRHDAGARPLCNTRNGRNATVMGKKEKNKEDSSIHINT